MTDPSTITPSLSIERLKRMLQFTDSDLPANRTGTLSEAQVKRLSYKKESSTNILFAGFLILFFVCGILFITAIGGSNNSKHSRVQPARSRDGGSGALTCIVIPLCLIVPLFFHLQRTSQDLETKKVMSVKGRVQHKSFYLNRSINYYYIILGDKTFNVSPFIYNAFAKEQNYIIYYTSSMTLVAVEHIPDPLDDTLASEQRQSPPQ